jgi:hypothetical protein
MNAELTPELGCEKHSKAKKTTDFKILASELVAH